MDYESSPDYIKAADLHNIGSGNASFFDDPAQYLTDKASSVGDTLTKIPDFAISSIASGVNSIYNSGVVATNFFGLSDTEENNLSQTLSAYDSDLGEYYDSHKQLADTAGFIATSFVPGLGGVKLAQTGQRVLVGAIKSGRVGSTLSAATGLATTATKTGFTLTEIAGKALAESGQTFSVMNAGVLKAIAGGVGQATYESLAFETMVAATMFKSPVLEGQDFKDIASNILLGGAVGGVIGGAVNAAGVYGGVKKILTAQDIADKPFTLRHSQYGLDKSPEARILVGAADLDATPLAISAHEKALSTTRITSIEQERRLAIHELSAGDSELGNFLADSTAGMTGEQITKTYQGLKLVARPGKISAANEDYTMGYVKMFGEGAGDTTFEPLADNMLTLADKFTGKKEVDAFVNAQGWGKQPKLWRPETAGSVDVAEARYIYAEKFAKYTDGMEIHSGDIAVLEGALRNQLKSVKIVSDAGTYEIKNLDDLANEILVSKRELVNTLGQAKSASWAMLNNSGTQVTSDEIARIANVPLSAIESKGLTLENMNARLSERASYSEIRKAKRLSGEPDLDYVPRHAAVVYDTTKISSDGNIQSALVNIKQQQKLQKEATDRAVNSIAGDLSDRMFHSTDKAMIESNRYGAGAGLVSFANGAYNSLASWAESIGSVTADLSTKLRKNTSAITDSVALRLRGNQAAAIEFDKIRNLVASTTERYVLNDAGDGLIAASVKKYQDQVRVGVKGLEVPVLRGGAPDNIPFINPLTGEAVAAHIDANGYRVSKNIELRNSVGLEDSRDPNIFYAHKPDPKVMPFFAFVKDDTVTGAGMGHTSMLHAASEVELNDMIKMAREKTGFTVYTKSDAENFYKAQKSYEFDRTLHENYIDSSLKSAGINNQFFPKTDPDKIVDEWLTWHAKGDDILARETISTKFGHEFDQLETLGSQYTNVAGSRYATNQKTIEATALNPYNDYRKTALNISRMGEYPILSTMNRNLEKGVSAIYQKITDSFAAVKDVNDLEKVNAALQEAGVNHAYKNAAEIILANHSAPKPALSKFIRGANAILSNTFLRLDPFNAINNAIGAQILLGSETSSQVRAVLRDIGVAGVKVPGVDDSILSSGKLIAKANSNFLSRDPQLIKMYKENGWMTQLSDQYKSTLDTLTLSGAENSAQLETKLGQAISLTKNLVAKGEVLTGNKLAEEYNRFVAADVARQISDHAIDAGVMNVEGQLGYINTFVNRTQGNMLASQRPLIFQGPIGQAVGLFQTYQFNVMQQLFRGISEGGAKDAAMMMGLQGTMYGLNGLPAFQFINQHIVGTASGNPNHRDAYSALYGAAGKEAGDWLMYGVPSNLLQANLYGRGDINPRNLTVIPTAPQDIVAVSAFGKFAGNIKETVSKMAGTGDTWQSFLQGVEHNGLSRPLAGLAQTLQATSGGKVYSTTNQGDISFVNDFMSLATLARLGGAKPMDEAIANDELARSVVYKAKDKERMKFAAETFKTNVIGDTSGQVTQEATQNYMKAFVHNGGRVEDFNKNMMGIITKVNTPRANQIMATMKGPYGQSMKELMGGKLSELDSME